MSQKAFSLVATVIFLVIGLMHALRLFFGWHAEVNGWILASEGIGLARKG